MTKKIIIPLGGTLNFVDIEYNDTTARPPFTGTS